MKTCIVYYSMSGNSEYAAGLAAKILDADLIKLEPVKAYPDSGFRKFYVGGRSAVLGERPPLKPYVFDGEKYDRVIFCFPVWAGRPAPPIKTFAVENREILREKKIAVLATFGGAGADKAIDKLMDFLDIYELEAELVLVEPKDRPDPENEEQIEDFCAELEE